jgi:hypothetical protein
MEDFKFPGTTSLATRLQLQSNGITIEKCNDLPAGSHTCTITAQIRKISRQTKEDYCFLGSDIM